MAAINVDKFPTVNHLVVIPAYNEPLSFIQGLQKFLAEQDNALAIVVLNQPEDDNNITVNMALSNAIKALPLYKPDAEHIYCVNNSYIYLVDCFHSQRLPRKQGVGLARKIGCDIAVKLYAYSKLNSPWLHCTDADVVLPTNYFAATQALDTNYAAALYPFQHFSEDSQTHLNIALYERRLHWYVAGLRWAQSPYAFHTVGSTLAVNVQHYCKVRGFPKLAAGEDFHLLNKLAKTGPIKSLAAPILAVSGRVSKRVPFGTGQAVATLAEQVGVANHAMFESPEVFVALQTVLASYPVFWRLASVDNALAIDDATVGITAALKHCGFPRMLAHAYRQAKSFEQFEKQLNTAFDALQSRRFLHYLAAGKHPNISLSELSGLALARTMMPSLAESSPLNN